MARADFLYPTYAEVCIGGEGGLVTLTQTDDTSGEYAPVDLDELTSGVSSFGGGYGTELIFEGRKYFVVFGVAFGNNTGMHSEVYYRFLLRDRWLAGVAVNANFLLGQSGGGELEPALPGLDFSWGLALSYRASRLELDLSLSPFSILNTQYFGPDGGYENVVIGALGPRCTAAANVFFTRRVGLRLAADYGFVWNLDQELEQAGYSAVDTQQILHFRGGLVYRF